MDSLTSTLSSISLDDPWLLWLYECNDFPQHLCHFGKAKICGFCKQAENLKLLITNSCEESGERWMDYMKKNRVYSNAQLMLRAIEREDNLLPSQFAKHICELNIFRWEKKSDSDQRKIRILSEQGLKKSECTRKNQNSEKKNQNFDQRNQNKSEF
uniref:Uncharacterized protein n=1 Tax=Meloidogyne incognita TaxID=6306 RepID=A0A914KK75_MELIC